MRGVPGLGEHTADVISTLGLSDEQVRAQLPYACSVWMDLRWQPLERIRQFAAGMRRSRRSSRPVSSGPKRSCDLCAGLSYTLRAAPFADRAHAPANIQAWTGHSLFEGAETALRFCSLPCTRASSGSFKPSCCAAQGWLSPGPSRWSRTARSSRSLCGSASAPPRGFGVRQDVPCDIVRSLGLRVGVGRRVSSVTVASRALTNFP